MGKIGGKVRNANETLRGGTRWSALGTAAGRDTGERAGVRCGAGHGRSRWDPLRGGTQLKQRQKTVEI